MRNQGSCLGPAPWPGPTLTICGDVDLFRKFGHIHLKPVLNVIEDFGIILVRYKSDSQTFGPKATCTGHLQGEKSGGSGQRHSLTWESEDKQGHVPMRPHPGRGASRKGHLCGTTHSVEVGV